MSNAAPPASPPSETEARNRHAAFMRGYRHGASGTASRADNHGWLATDYSNGFQTGSADAERASRAATERYDTTGPTEESRWPRPTKSWSRVHWVAKVTLAPACKWPDIGPWWARIRRWVVHTVLRHDSESCDACGCRMPGCWWAESDGDWRAIYEHIVGDPPTSTEWGISGGLLCPNCFARGATALRHTATVTLGPG